MKKTIQRERVVNLLKEIYDDLSRREQSARELSKQTGSGFSRDFYIEKAGTSLGFQWSAQEIQRLIDTLENE